ncbi:MAG: hypothetical protein MUP14_07885 [Dehalococcoidia bacterium]|nr:hypothetical protein [Dehalococcoidia bacterium]
MPEPTVQDESTFEALQRFRAYTSKERWECLFLDTQRIRQGVAACEIHLRISNGTTASTAALLNIHLREHEAGKERAAGMKFLGTGFQRGLTIALGLATGALVLLEAVQRLHGG